MGCNCNYNPEQLNKLLKEAIKKQNFFAIYKLLVLSNLKVLDPCLIHDAVKTGHIDVIDVFIDFSKAKLEFNLNELDKFGKLPIDYAFERGHLN